MAEDAEDAEPDLGSFVGDHGQALLRFAFLLTGGNAAEAEDLLQTVLARLAGRGLGGLDDPLAYARRAIVNEQHSLGRRLALHRRTLPRLVQDEAVQPAAAVADDRLTVLRALAGLTERERAVVVLRYYEDLPDEAIADAIGCSRPTVRSLVHRALPKLRAELGDTYAGGPARTMRGAHDD